VADPYTYPGTDVLTNRLNLRDQAALTAAERDFVRLRGDEAARLEFALTPDGFRAVHLQLFQDVYEWAGENRTVDIAKGGGAYFAKVPFIERSLEQLFKDLARGDGLKGLPRDDFFDQLGNHINELNAIHAFREGNGRTMRVHAERIAQSAGHPIRISGIDAGTWMNASRHGFVTGDHRALAQALAGARLSADLSPPATLGVVGIALLPPRDPPTGQRYQVSTMRSREELSKYLSAARVEAANRLAALERQNAPTITIDEARQEMAFVRHAKGPIYQSLLLEAAGQRSIEAAINGDQSPLERIREISAATAVALNRLPVQAVERAARTLAQPVPAPGQSPHQDRLASIFLSNTPELNRADARFSAAQAFVDEARQRAVDRAPSDKRAPATATETARNQVAGKIRRGETIEQGVSRSLGTPAIKAPEKGRDRSR
jgi:cell filamentation protein